MVALVVATALTVAGMLTFSLTIEDVVQNLAVADAQWGDTPVNASVGVLLREAGLNRASSSLVLVAISAAGTYLWSRWTKDDLTLALGGTLLILIFLAPVSWAHYDLFVLPLAVYLAIRGGRSSAAMAWAYLYAWALVSMLAMQGEYWPRFGSVALIRLLLAVSIGLAAIPLRARLWTAGEAAAGGRSRAWFGS